MGTAYGVLIHYGSGGSNGVVTSSPSLGYMWVAFFICLIAAVYNLGALLAYRHIFQAFRDLALTFRQMKIDDVTAIPKLLNRMMFGSQGPSRAGGGFGVDPLTVIFFGFLIIVWTVLLVYAASLTGGTVDWLMKWFG